MRNIAANINTRLNNTYTAEQALTLTDADAYCAWMHDTYDTDPVYGTAYGFYRAARSDGNYTIDIYTAAGVDAAKLTDIFANAGLAIFTVSCDDALKIAADFETAGRYAVTGMTLVYDKDGKQVPALVMEYAG